MEPRRLVARSMTYAVRPAHVGIVRRAAVDAADDAARTLSVCLVPWGEVARVSDDGRTFYDESWMTGSLEPADLVAVYDGHRPTPAGVERGSLIGRAAPSSRTGRTACSRRSSSRTRPPAATPTPWRGRWAP